MKYDDLRMEHLRDLVRQELGAKTTDDYFICRYDIDRLWREAKDEDEFVKKLKEYFAD